MRGAAHGFPIVLSDLTLEYPAHGASPAHVALHGLTLTVEPGEVLGLLGSAGSGKSTLAKVLSGSAFEQVRGGDVRPVITGGEANVLGRRLRTLPKRKVDEFRFHVGYLPQDAAATLPPDRTVAEIVGEPILERDRRYNRRALATRVATMIDAVRLPLSMLDKFPYELSGGQRQRVVLAQALCCRPALLLADEPTASLDSTTQAEVLALLSSLQSRLGLAVLMASHDLGALAALARRVLVMYAGAVVEEGTPAEVFGAPRHPHSRALSRAYPRPPRPPRSA